MPFIPQTDEDQQAMLAALGLTSVEELFADIPAHLREQADPDLPPALTELEATKHLGELAADNLDLTRAACFLGAGVYDHFIPAIVDEVTCKPGFVTAYTSYQAEVHQGLLQALYEYQTMVCELLGLDVANASVYDGATALAEAALMATAATRRHLVVCPQTVHPQYRQVLRTILSGMDLDLLEAPYDAFSGCTSPAQLDADEPAALLIQQPNFFGALEPVEDLVAWAHQRGALAVVCANPIALGLLKSPGECGADIAVAEGQPLGLPPSFGGPLLGLMACREQHLRRLPGRICGATTDADGRRGYVLTMQAREQHIRRERATSNICTNQTLMALRAAAYLMAVGPPGLREVATLCLQKAHALAQRLAALDGFSLPFTASFFHEFVLRCPRPPADINAHLLEANIIGGLPLAGLYDGLEDAMLLCVTEQRTDEEMDLLVEALGNL